MCTTDTRVEPDNIIDFINYPKRIFPIGRLDKPSEGLIFLTNDGDIVNKILRAANNHEKEYVVSVDKPINATFCKRMGGGLPIWAPRPRSAWLSSVVPGSSRLFSPRASTVRYVGCVGSSAINKVLPSSAYGS